jgi:hypothetical protein
MDISTYFLILTASIIFAVMCIETFKMALNSIRHSISAFAYDTMAQVKYNFTKSPRKNINHSKSYKLHKKCDQLIVLLQSR